MNRLAEILRRIEEIQTEVRAGNVSDELNAELDQLLAEKKSIQDKQGSFQRKFEEANLPVNVPNNDIDQSIAKMSRREKMCLIIGRQARNKKFTDAEKRALGSALTITATTFVEAAADASGVNNAGVLIPTSLLLDLLKEEKKLSPILADINFTAVPGLLEFPFRETRDQARVKAEGAEGLQNQMKWAKLSLVKGYLQTVIAVTDEVMALTDFDFGAYIVDQLMQDINDDWVAELLYGTGADDHIKGITIGATAAVAGGYEANKVTDALIAGIKQCKGKYRRGAKIYAAQDVFDEILFQVDDNGNFKYPIFNNTTGIQSVGTIRMELDENLKGGEFLIGNVNKYFKVNSLIPLRMETDRQAKKGITEYIASEYCASAPFAGAFVHGKKKA